MFRAWGVKRKEQTVECSLSSVKCEVQNVKCKDRV